MTSTKIPARLGRYEILDELGKGAMGVVFLARDPLIGRLVALKTFRIGFSVRDAEMEQFRARFMREAQSAGILSHPNIVTVHDVVEKSEEGLAFIAMEYVQGTNLKMLLQRGTALDLPFAVAVIEQVADALDYAHSKGVVHRDIKPANLLITADNRVKITDFGIARLDTSNLTQEGQLLGTPNYMSPEQIQGREVDHRTDLFSLGVVLYEMLTRHKPFQGENLTVVSHKIVYDAFVPLDQYNQALPSGVQAILSRAMDKDPASRYQRAREMAEDLRRLVGSRAAVSEELNETQSLSETSALSATTFTPPDLPLPPAPPVPPVIPEGPSASTASRVASRGSRSGKLWLRWALLLVLFAGLGAAGWWGLSRWTQGLDPGAPDAATEEQRAQVVALLQQARERAQEGDWATATSLFRQAEGLAPENPGLRRLRLSGEGRAQSQLQSAQSELLAGWLAQARSSLAAQRYQDAVSAATAVIQADPANSEAPELLAAANQALARRSRVPVPARPDGTLPGVEAPGDLAATEAPTAPPAATENAKASLRVEFYSALPEGVLILYLEEKQVLRKEFAFYEKTGLLGRRAARAGRKVYTLPVEVGTVNLRVYVTPAGRKAAVQNISGNFPGGQRNLEVRLEADGQLNLRLSG
jgi:serine/threonine protein kinase